MMKLLFSGVVALAMLHAVPGASAQDKVDGRKVEELKKTDPLPPATGKSLPEQAGTQEPSSKVKDTGKDTAVFVDGMLTAAGAPTITETQPAKFSARVAADDRLPIAAYRLRRLGDEQRREIAQGLGRERPVRPAAGAEAGADEQWVVGSLVPASTLPALTPVPEAVAAKFAELRGAGFLRSGGKLVLVDLDNMLVIGVLEN